MKATVRTHHRSPRGRRSGALAAAAAAVLLATTGCEPSGSDGAQDAAPSDRPSATGSPKPDGSGAAKPGGGADGTGGGKGGTGDGGNGGSGEDAGKGDSSTVTACAEDDLSFSATTEDTEGEPVRHLLLTVTNAGDKKCNLYHYPDVRLGADAQAPVAVIKESDPKALATLAPGEEAYAALLVSGGARDTYEANTIIVSLQGRKPGSTASGPIHVDLPGVDALTADDGARVTYWMTASGLALRFIMSS
ncbi:DUF4232 domain-containing protein [Streptomyces sp. NPDC093595]|uniref:DUF4232 domain-containing protein n=1 Tax=Streptomyces sp. NPDC093595 TaxID=3366045 RepID=UPI00380A667B